MRRSARGGWSVAAGSLALVGLVAILAAPAPARAGCGGHDLSWSSDLRGTMALLDVPASESSAPPRWPVNPPRCSGPSCSGMPASPPGSGDVRLAPVTERWAAAEPPAAAPTDGAISPTAPEPTARPRAVARTLFRPPRATARG